jgi:hypothetical protein
MSAVLCCVPGLEELLETLESKVELWTCCRREEGLRKKTMKRFQTQKGGYVAVCCCTTHSTLLVVGQPAFWSSFVFFQHNILLEWILIYHEPKKSLGFRVFLRIFLDKQPKNMGGVGRVLSRGGGWVEVLHQYFIFKYVSWYHPQENLAISGYMF